MTFNLKQVTKKIAPYIFITAAYFTLISGAHRFFREHITDIVRWLIIVICLFCIGVKVRR